MLILLGVLIVSLPISLALRTVLRLVRVLGGADAAEVAVIVSASPDVDLAPIAEAVRREAPGSIPDRLLTAVTTGDDRALARRLSLAEAVADIERSVVDDVRVPRVAASLATTSGLLAAALVMREGLSATVVEEGGAAVVARFTGVIERGLTMAAIAVLGGVVCAALHRTAQKERRARLDELDALVSPLAVRFGNPLDGVPDRK